MHQKAELPPTELVESCPICGERSADDLFEAADWLYGRPGSFRLVRCRGCGLMYLRTRPTRESLPTYYPDDTYYSYRDPVRHNLFGQGSHAARVWYFGKRSVLAHKFGYRHLGGTRATAWISALPGLHKRATFGLDVLLHPWVERGALLEVGCGSGTYLDLMRALGWNRTCGVDINPGAAARAREVLGLEAHAGELWDAHLADESFDAVSVSHTLEHVTDPMRLLREVRRVLKPGGRLSIVVPNASSLCSRQYERQWWQLDPPRHVVNYTPPTLDLALRLAGFEVQELRTSPRGAYAVALHSRARRKGDPLSVYTDRGHRYSRWRKAHAKATAAVERVLCGLGRDLGEEILAAAQKPSSD